MNLVSLFQNHESRQRRFTLVVTIVAITLASGLARGEELATSTGGPQPYDETIDNEGNSLAMIPLRAGEFQLGSPAEEAERKGDEGPQRTVHVDGFWIGKFEVTWRQFYPYLSGPERTITFERTNESGKKVVDAITRPSSISWHINVLNIGMEDQQPVAGITQHTAKVYCQWLSAKTGHFYRLPTEAEWEYACRAGTTSSYHFGDEEKQLADHAWFAPNAYDVGNASDEGYRDVGQKKPNAWGLYDMHGNVSEWVLDGYDAKAYSRLSESKNANPLLVPKSLYPRVTRGGSWKDAAAALRSAARTPSDPEWKEPEPRFPKSIWFHRSGEFVGFRIVRPFAEPTAEDRERAVPDEHQQ